MNYISTFFVSIATAIGSLFGMSHTATTSIPISSVPVQQVAPAPQISDEQSIINTVTAMLNADRNVATLQDQKNVMAEYSSQESIQQFQAGISKVPTSSMPIVQNELVTVDHAYPNPTSLQFSVMVNGDVATATAALPTTTQAVNSTMTATYQNSITIPLQKENGQWKVNTVILTSKGVSTKSTK